MLKEQEFFSLQTLSKLWNKTYEEILQLGFYQNLSIALKIDLKQDTEERFCIKEKAYLDPKGNPVPFRWPKYEDIRLTLSKDSITANNAARRALPTLEEMKTFDLENATYSDEIVESKLFEKLTNDDIGRLLQACSGDKLKRPIGVSEFKAQRKYTQRYLAGAKKNSNTFWPTDMNVDESMLFVHKEEVQRFESKMLPEYIQICDVASKYKYSDHYLLQLGFENKIPIYLGLFDGLYCVHPYWEITSGENKGALFCSLSDEFSEALENTAIESNFQRVDIQYVRIKPDSLSKIMNKEPVTYLDCFNRGFIVGNENERDRKITVNDLFVRSESLLSLVSRTNQALSAFSPVPALAFSAVSKQPTGAEVAKKSPSKAIRRTTCPLWVMLEEIIKDWLLEGKKIKARELWEYLQNHVDDYEMLQEVDDWSTSKRKLIKFINHKDNDDERSKKAFKNQVTKITKKLSSNTTIVPSGL